MFFPHRYVQWLNEIMQTTLFLMCRTQCKNKWYLTVRFWTVSPYQWEKLILSRLILQILNTVPPSNNFSQFILGPHIDKAVCEWRLIGMYEISFGTDKIINCLAWLSSVSFKKKWNFLKISRTFFLVQKEPSEF